MRRVLPLLIVVLALPALAHASINRCAASDGVWIYTDQPCSAHRAKVRAPPLDLPGDATKGAAAASSAATPPAARAALTPNADVSRFANAGIGCAAYSKSGLVAATRRALAARDPNQLAGLTDWQGTSTGAANAVMARYASFAKQPVVDIGVDAVATTTVGATAALERDPYDPQPPVYRDFGPMGVEAIRVEFADGTGALSGSSQYLPFGMKGRCYWLKP